MRFLRVVLLVVIAVSGTGCTQMLHPLKAGPAPDSGFLPQAERMTEQRDRYPFHRVWCREEGLAKGTTQELYIAPVDISRLRNTSWWHADEEQAAGAIRDDAQELAAYIRETFREQILQTDDTKFVLVDQVRPHTVVLHLAIVELTPTDVSRNVAGTIASMLLPGGGLISLGSQGAIAIEGLMQYGKGGDVFFMFADRERGKAAPINLNDFTFFSHARDVIDDWARQWAILSSTADSIQVADSLPITFSPV